MSNESYLICSYFAAAGIGLFLAALTASELARPLREAVAGLTEPMARILRRVLPVWLILAVLLGFMSVTYFDCAHDSYATVGYPAFEYPVTSYQPEQTPDYQQQDNRS